uniref:NADH-ubiquinone oxidoreductase chain 5 n=1 Tax=Amblyomma triguttatum TaxID=65637 RepID=Q6I7M4_9ACAR|nr:NADH dehydrogenase subunit 5 [Amblyomma triguttatum]BAD24959.1 NADH dehydrogenease subunit 5 [Amblyomma triguttatum]
MYLNWSIMLMFMVFIFSFVYIFSFYMNSIYIMEYYFNSIQNMDFKFYFLFDWMSILFSITVLMISSMVIMYSKSYMNEDKNKISFCFIVLLFVSSMIILILMPNMFMIILGWDGLGLVSYCLVIYYQSINSYNSGMMTIISNRVGDVMIILSLIFFVNFGSFDLISLNKIELICGVMILIAAFTKSAQIPFSAWLPAAMAAPTPVSSLVHSSTLVTAGVYLLMRFNFLFKMNFYCLILIKISLMTMMMAGISAFFETDFKKIIAFSTLSQLSMMMITISLGSMELAFFHLIMHAFFKSLLFLCAGLVIHSFFGIQDIRMLGNFFKLSPFISTSMIISLFSLMGFPFIGGFYSKDLIVEFFFFKINNIILFMIFILGILSTFLYCLRMAYMMLFKGIKNLILIKFNFDFFMKFSIFVLCFFVLISGNFMFWLISSNLSAFFISKISKIWTLFMMMILIYFLFIKNTYFITKFVKIDFFYKIWNLSFLTSFVFLKKNNKLLYSSISDWTWMEILGTKTLYTFSLNFLNFNYWIEAKNLNKILLVILGTILIIF